MIYTCPNEPSSENPLVMYFIVRESLNMGAGKIAAQVGHAVQLIMLDADEIRKTLPILDNTPESNKPENNHKLLRYIFWLNKKTNGGFRKVVLKADDKEWQKIKDEYQPIIVVDAGLTEIPAQSETVAVLWPMLKDERSKTLKRLRALK